MIKKPHDRQHHGNLKEALVLAGLKLLEEGGPSALTLRGCAALAGVSHAAPAHHFNGLPGLKSAIAIRGYKIFEDMMKEGIAAAGPNKRKQALGMCLGYLKFAMEHSALFKLIFDSAENFERSDEWQNAAKSARQVLNDMSASFVHGPGGQSETEVALFSFVHGYAKLMEIGRVVPGSGDGRDVKFEDVFAMLNLEIDQKYSL